MSEQPPPGPPPPDSDEPAPPADSPYGSPPPPPASNPYAPPPPAAAPPAAPAYPPPPPPPPPPAPSGYVTPPPPPGYQAPTYAAPGGGPATPSKGHGGLAITALVISIVAIVTFWFPILGIVLALAGLVLGVIAWATAGKNDRPKGMGVAATIISVFALLASVAATIFFLWFWDKAGHCFDPDFTQTQTEQCFDDAFNNDSGF